AHLPRFHRTRRCYDPGCFTKLDTFASSVVRQAGLGKSRSIVRLACVPEVLQCFAPWLSQPLKGRTGNEEGMFCKRRWAIGTSTSCQLSLELPYQVSSQHAPA